MRCAPTQLKTSKKCLDSFWSYQQIALTLQAESTEKETMIVTGRDFRANQSKYISIAHSGEDVILKSRAGSVRLIPVGQVEGLQEPKKNRVYIENGEVKVDFVTDTMSLEEAKELTLKAIDLEYSLP